MLVGTDWTGSYSRFSYNKSKNYVMMLKEQGVPVLDDEFNVAQETLLTLHRDAIEAISGSGATSYSAFKITPASDANDFTINAGTLFVNGWQLTLASNITYNTQPLSQTQVALPALVTPSSLQVNIVYVDVWYDEINGTEDSTIIDPTLNTQTNCRLKLFFAVRVAQGSLMPPNGVDTQNRYHWYYQLATINWTANATMFTQSMIVDNRNILPVAPVALSTSNIGQATANTANTYTSSINNITALVPGTTYYIQFLQANTGASTLQINDSTALAINDRNGNPIPGGAIRANEFAKVLYDGTQFIYSTENLAFDRTFKDVVVHLNSNITLTQNNSGTVYILDSPSSNATITLPAPVSGVNFMFIGNNTGAYNYTFFTNSGNFIFNGASATSMSFSALPGHKYFVISDGTNYYLFNNVDLPTLNAKSASIANNLTAGSINTGTLSAGSTTVSSLTSSTSINASTGSISGSFSAGTYNNLPVATSSALGIVKPDGTSITIANGVLSATPPAATPIATSSTLGIVRPDNSTITISNGVLTASLPPSTPVATSSTLGTVMPDNSTITISNGVLTSISGQGAWTNNNVGFDANSNGYVRFPDGLIIQWGIGNTGTAGNVVQGNISFPIAFPNACFQVVGSPVNTPSGVWGAITFRIPAVYQSYFVYYLDTSNANYSISNNVQVRYFAIGY